jgi:adenine deaminase
MVREGSTARNLRDLLPLISPKNSRRFFFVTDDRHPKELLEEGHINSMIKQAIRLGLDPVLAIQMATLNAAEYFRLDDIGAIAPGFKADLLSFDHLGRFQVRKVFKDGILVAENGKMLSRSTKSPQLFKSKENQELRIKEMTENSFVLRSDQPLAKVIQLIPNQILTKKALKSILLMDGVACPDLQHDILKIAVVERHQATGNLGIGFVQGFGLKKGAIGSTIAHDSHNLIVVGTNDEDMLKVVGTIKKMGGGLAVVSGGKMIADLPLPIAGLMSEKSVSQVHRNLESLQKAIRKLGCQLPDPLMALSFLSLPVIPELKITDKGLVDVNQFRIVPVFGED